MPPKTVEVFAPAKINLTLHVTGLRDDGYHLLDSLVAFADIGDTIRATEADELGLSIEGPFASALPLSDDNLVLCAARSLGAPRGAVITLTKRLPVASGIGGGSADAAATLLALSRLWGVSLPDEDAVLALGADVPVCLAGQPVRMSGVGEGLSPVPSLPPLHIVLVNPGVSVSTPEVFRALRQKDNAPMPGPFPDWPDAEAFCAWLAAQRNDLELPARTMAPAIGVVLARLEATPGCLLARMSGSGATCFGLYADRVGADAAAAEIKARHPDWWVEAAGLTPVR
ncbi:MAG: 4-(cytidine 5'-diphospho)-2-C-methyl-D-erythritol kinase [Rhodobacteraceae bacterium]|nr:4-(cytidine 5'-diphospho)-2-C-methyl-D-erythritol kinase [Paracoccaceae bacterium]